MYPNPKRHFEAQIEQCINGCVGDYHVNVIRGHQGAGCGAI